MITLKAVEKTARCTTIAFFNPTFSNSQVLSFLETQIGMPLPSWWDLVEYAAWRFQAAGVTQTSRFYVEGELFVSFEEKLLLSKIVSAILAHLGRSDVRAVHLLRLVPLPPQTEAEKVLFLERKAEEEQLLNTQEANEKGYEEKKKALIEQNVEEWYLYLDGDEYYRRKELKKKKERRAKADQALSEVKLALEGTPSWEELKQLSLALQAALPLDPSEVHALETEQRSRSYGIYSEAGLIEEAVSLLVAGKLTML